MTVGENIQRYRKELGLSQEELGQKLFVSRQTVSLWEEDQALQADIDYIGIDLSHTSLTKSEQDALAWRFGELKGKEVLVGTFDELCEQGFIDGENLYWENGCLLSIEEEGLPDEESYLNKVLFRAQKWRSGLGAIMFTSCTAERDKTGHWGEYTAGGFAIA